MEANFTKQGNFTEGDEVIPPLMVPPLAVVKYSIWTADKAEISASWRGWLENNQ